MTTAAVLAQMGSNNTTFRNRIINGAMMIDQRNAGASVTATTSNLYTLDRFYAQATQNSKYTVQLNAGSITPPVGFTNYLGVTSSSSYSVLSTDQFAIVQNIEAFNVFDLAWGASNAKSVTLSFWVYSSLTGTFGGCLENNAGTRSYTFTYSIGSANTWTQIAITIPGDTTGTWLNNTNGIGIRCILSLGQGSTYQGTPNTWNAGNYGTATGCVSVVGTNGATFYITGVQLEAGTNATPFEFRPYGTELALCQRYFEKSSDDGVAPSTNSGLIGWTSVGGNSYPRLRFQFKVPKRATPTLTFYDGAGTSGQISTWNNGTVTSGVVSNVQLNTTEASAERQDATVLASRAFVYGAFLATAEL